MLNVKRPLRLLEPVTGADLPLDFEKLKVDSDEAINNALKEPLLENIKATSTQLELERLGEGVGGHRATAQAAWKVKLWAARVGDPSRSTAIGEIWVSATDGKVVKTDLHLERLN